LGLFSVVIPAYNAEDTLAETLDSVLTQSRDDWECIVVDDGSTDGTRTLAEAYGRRDARIHVIVQQNRGTGGAYNTGVRAAAGDQVIICSADDMLLPPHLQMMSEAIAADPGIDICTCNGFYLRPDGTRTLVYAEGDRDEPRDWALEDLFQRCFFSVGACYRRSLFDEVGGYREDIFGEDYDFWLRAMASGARHAYIPEPLSIHRVSEKQKSADVARAYESDIRSIQDVVETFELSDTQKRAADRALRLRARLIAEVTVPDSLSVRLRQLVRRIVHRGTRS